MSKTLWHYADNQFDNATKNSKKRMNILSADHLSKLEAEQSDPDIVLLVERFSPVRNEYATRYDQWLKAKGFYKGATRKEEEILNELSSDKIAEWDNQIKVEVGEDSSDYVSILPDHRKPFQKSARDQRIREVSALALRLDDYPALAAVKKEIESFLAQMEFVRDVQQQKEELVGKRSDELEEQRVITAKMMYANLGRLMDKFTDNPVSIERFYELQIIQQHPAPDEEEEVEEIIPEELGEGEPPAEPPVE